MGRSGISFYDWCKNNNYMDLFEHLIDKNDGYKYSYASHVRVWWQCDNKHTFDIDFCKFTNPSRNRGNVGRFTCPYCAGQKVMIGYNDLATTNPELAKEWDYEKNDLTPKEITKSSRLNAWWKCSYGHSWNARVSARDYGNGCPYCAKRSKSSIIECLLYVYVTKYFPDAVHQARLGLISCDIYIPSLRVAIEYDGGIWHSISSTDYKYESLKQSGVRLLTITGVCDSNRPDTVIIDDRQINLYDVSNNFCKCLPYFFKTYLGVDIDLSDYSNDLIKAKSYFYSNKNKNIVISDKMRDWWSPLNGYSIDIIQNDNNDKIWRCDKGHTFYRRYDVFMNRGCDNCPYCTHRLSFQYYLICISNNIYYVYDKSDGSLDCISRVELLELLKSGINICGINILRNDEIICYVWSEEFTTSYIYDIFRYYGIIPSERLSSIMIADLLLSALSSSYECLHDKINLLLRQSI